jgi:hypothetical protein
MKKYLTIIILMGLPMWASLNLAGFVPAEGVVEKGDAFFTVARLLIAGSIENAEPVGIVNAFASSTEKVYCFLEARDIQEDSTVSFVWYHADSEVARVPLQLKQGQRWRTWSSKRLGGHTGTWRVELQDAEGKVLETVEFLVE